jgi:predicted DNA-binding protein (MmcQ/YjbR family)
MSPSDLDATLLDLPEVSVGEPYEPDIPVYKVSGKVFAILQPKNTEAEAQITLKCDPDLALHLREQYAAVVPGYHVNKRLWNTVVLDGSVPDVELAEMIRHSYEQAAAGLHKADRERVLAALHG